MARRAKPWFRKQTGWWMVVINGQQVKLVEGKDKKKAAERKYHEIMAGMAQAPESATARTADLVEAFLRHSRVHFANDTHRLHRFYCQSFAEACGQVLARDMKAFHVSRWVDAKVESGTWGKPLFTTPAARRSASSRGRSSRG